MKLSLILLTFFLYFSSFFNTLAAEELHTIHAPENKLTPYLEIFEDTSGTMTIDEVKREKFKSVNLINKKQSINKGFTDSAIWVKIALKIDSTKHHWMLEQYDWYINELDLYVENIATKGIEKFHTSNLIPFKERLHPNTNLIFPLELHPENEYLLYLRYKSKQPLEIRLALWENDAFSSYIETNNMVWGIFYGGLGIIIIYTSLLLFSIREATYFYYICYVLSVMLTLSHIHGDLYRYIFPNNPEITFFIGRLHTPIFVFSALQFSRSFLRTDLFSKPINNALIGFQLVTVVTLFSSIFLSFGHYQIIIFTFVGISYLMLISVGLYLLKKGHKEAKYYLIAWSPPAFFVFLAATRFVYTFPIDINFRIFVPIGFLMEMCLFSFALAHRINLLQQENKEQLKSIIDGIPVPVLINRLSDGA
ncbi:MAG: hypothetical protein HQK84_05070, partial [Nitrospinae bacterium]|nr:hypothetical protein [Nitrospinota bacterium]